MARLRADGVTLLPRTPATRPHRQHHQRHVSAPAVSRPRAPTEEAKKNGAGRRRRFAIRARRHATIEVPGDVPAERFNHLLRITSRSARSLVSETSECGGSGMLRRTAPKARTDNCKQPRGADKTFPAL